MSLRKLLLLAAVSAIASFGIATGSASASVYCYNTTSPCSAANTVPAGHVLTGTSTGSPTWAGTLSITCAHSATTEVVTTMDTADVTSLTFSGCHVTGTTNTCTYLAHAGQAHSVLATTTVSGVEMTVTCLGIPCTFTGAGAGGSVTGTNIANTPTIAFESVPLTASGGTFCGTTATLTVTYDFKDDSSSPAGKTVFITAS